MNPLPPWITLPPHLAERTVSLTHAAPRTAGEFVLYWTHHALRAHENPALDVAATLAMRLNQPLLVYDPPGAGPLPALLARSALLVSELYPVPPFTTWYPRHAAAHADLPWLLVDASCILPMPLSQRRPSRAFQFRRAHGGEQRSRAAAPWPQVENWPTAFVADPGFQPFDLASPLSPAIAHCRIDH